MQPISRPEVIANGVTAVVDLAKERQLTRTVVTVNSGTSGVLTFRVRTIGGQLESPEAPSTLDAALKKTIYFDGAALEAIEIANAGASPVTVVITQLAP